MTADKRTDVLDAMDAETEVKFQAIPSSGGAAVWEKYIPSLYWLPKYSIKNFLISDIIGGITACIMLIPQGMGYALIAGLEPIYGLYSALFGPLIYGFFGTCGQITVAPMAVVSLMILQTVREYIVDETNPVEFAAIASAVTFQAGIILILLGLIKGGILASMLSRPVMIGFTAAAACLIGTSQLKFVFNVSSDSGNFIVMISSVIGALGGTHIPSLMLSIGSIIFLAGVKIAKKKWASKYVAVKFFPSELVMVVIGILVTFANQDAGFNIIGDIPKGLPPFKNFFGEFSGKIFWNQGLWVQSFLIAVLCFIESFAGGKKYADKFNYDIDASQELVALGICNAIGSWFGCYISGGALSRTVVVGEAGARSPLTALIAGVFMIIAIISLLGVFKFIPKPVLGCIVLVGVSGLFDTAGMKHLWKVSKKDFVIMCATVLLTLLVGIDVGVGAGVVLSIAIFVQESAKPHYSILGRTTKDDENSGYVSPDSDNEDLGKKAKKGGGHASGNKYYRYVDVKHEENLRIRPDMLMVRWDASLFFGNFSSFQKRISKHIERLISRNSEHLNTTENTFCLCLVFDSVISIDTTAIGLLYNFTIELKKKYPNVLILVHNIKKQVYNIFEKHELIFNEIPKNHIMHGSLYDCEKYWNKVLLKKFPDYFNRPIRMMTAKKIEPQYTESNIVEHASSHSGEIGVSYGDAENDIAEVIVTNEEV